MEAALDTIVERTTIVCTSQTAQVDQAFAERCVDEHLGGIMAEAEVAA